METINHRKLCCASRRPLFNRLRHTTPRVHILSYRFILLFFGVRVKRKKKYIKYATAVFRLDFSWRSAFFIVVVVIIIADKSTAITVVERGRSCVRRNISWQRPVRRVCRAHCFGASNGGRGDMRSHTTWAFSEYVLNVVCVCVCISYLYWLRIWEISHTHALLCGNGKIFVAKYLLKTINYIILVNWADITDVVASCVRKRTGNKIASN